MSGVLVHGWDKSGRSGQYSRVLCSPSEGPGQFGEMDREQPSEIQERQMQAPPYSWRIIPHPSTGWGDLLESSSVEKALVVLVDTKLSMSQQCVLGAKEASGAWGALGRALPVHQGADPAPLVSPDEVHLECCVQF